MDASTEILPSSFARTDRGEVFVQTTKIGGKRHGMWHRPSFCANCGRGGGPLFAGATHAFWLCRNCEHLGAEGQPAGMALVPDEVFNQRVFDLQMEKFGRTLNAKELLEALANSDHPLSRLARERYRLPEYKDSRR